LFCKYISINPLSNPKYLSGKKFFDPIEMQILSEYFNNPNNLSSSSPPFFFADDSVDEEELRRLSIEFV
jgi:hypothetical protein